MRHTLKKIAQLLDASFAGEDREIREFQADSRKICPGDLFVALKGNRVDGHAFIEEAISKGACAAIVKEDVIADFFIPLFRVKDPLKALHFLAKKLAEGRGAKVIGVTGSVGKTTTKEFIAHLLSFKFKVAKTQGTQNSQVTFPLAVINQIEEVDTFVAEMGMSEKGELARLVDILAPDIGVITQIGLAHSQFFSSVEEIAEAKAEIFSHPKTKLAILGKETERFESIKNLKMDKRVCGGECDMQLPFEATHLKENAALAILVAKEMGMTCEEIARATTTLKPYERRFELVEKEGIFFLNDSYNANPISMRAALLNFPMPKGKGRRVAALGEMRELGNFSKEAHIEIGRLSLDTAERLFCLGKEWEVLAGLKRVEIFSTFEAFKQALLSYIDLQDVVLLKGSNSLQLWRVLE